MKHSLAIKSALIGVCCFAFGFLAADKMTSVGAVTASIPQESTGSGFSGTDGAVVIKGTVVVIRGKRIYRIDPTGQGGGQRPWGELTE